MISSFRGPLPGQCMLDSPEELVEITTELGGIPLAVQQHG